MSWPGYWLFGGTEVINVARTEAYSKRMGAPWLKPIYGGSDLALVLGQTYVSPLQDGAPWVDSGDPASFEFLGIYPLDITGVEDSTGTATIVESVLDGGVVGGQRRATRSMVFNVVLIGVSEAGCEAGMRWLKQVLASADCNAIWGCAGQTVCYLTSQPCVNAADCTYPSSPADCLATWQRSLYQVAVITGPNVTAKNTMFNGGEAWQVQFTATAGNPFVFGPVNDLVRDFMHTDDSPYVDPNTGTWFDTGANASEVVCDLPTWRPFSDPDCPQIVPPPTLPGIPLNCFTFPVNFLRRWFTIGSETVPVWGQVVPRFVLRTFDDEPGPVRVRFYPLNKHGDIIDPCGYCGDMTVGYLPPDAALVVDGSTQTIYVQVGDDGPARRADAVIYGTDGAPFEWPLLTCATSFMCTVDTLRSKPDLSMDLSLTTRAL